MLDVPAAAVGVLVQRGPRLWQLRKPGPDESSARWHRRSEVGSTGQGQGTRLPRYVSSSYVLPYQGVLEARRSPDLLALDPIF